ncbi:MAG: diguanylate cyclase [Ketobacteraceae bacterium]|nr:diguanylate cyclase [Ketobacteraceae bacterium]
MEDEAHFLVDYRHELTIDQVLSLEADQWQPVRGEFSLGLTEATVWVRLSMPREKTPLFEHPPVLVLTNPLLNRVHLYLVKQQDVLASSSTGDHYPLESRSIPVPEIYWQLPGSWREASDLYVKIHSDSFFQSHFLLKDTPAALIDHGGRYWMLGLFYGALLIMLFYNLFIYFQVKDIRYFYYTGYVFCAGLFHSVMDGLPYYLLSGYYEAFADRLSVYFLDLANIFALLFVIRFLDLRDKALLNATRTLIIMFLVAIFVEIIETGHISTLFSMFMTMVTSLSITYLTVKSWLSGNEQARYLAMAWIALLISIPVYAMALYGWLPHNTYTLNSVRFGVVMEMALISFSLAHRINLLRQDRIMLQSRLNKELGGLVRERTRELEEANRKLQALSETDSLTQLKNRAFFNKAIEEEASRAKRQQTSLALLLADLDHFKKINDSVGHNAGDYCIKQFARVLQEQLSRTTDIACRYGGEEFVAILPDTDLNGAVTVAERIRRTVEQSRFIFEGKTIELTVSIGVFTVTPHADWNCHDWIAKADKALYFAKTERNRVAFIRENGDPRFADLMP